MRMPEMAAPGVSGYFLPLIKGNEDSGNEIGRITAYLSKTMLREPLFQQTTIIIFNLKRLELANNFDVCLTILELIRTALGPR